MPAELIRVRDPLFDDDGLDAVLLELVQQIEELRPLRDNLSELYQLDRLPSQEQLARAVAIIHQGGFFSWFKSDWRNAKALLTGLSRQPGTKFAELKRWSTNLVKYTELLQRFEQRAFGNQLGSAYRGLDTDCVQLMQLRDWYKQVRACYGIGFGKRVAIGSDVMALDGEIIKGVHQIEKSQFSTKIMALVKQAENETKLLPRIAHQLKDHPVWLGEQGALRQACQQVQATLTALQGWFVNTDVSLGQMTHFSDLLQKCLPCRLTLKIRNRSWVSLRNQSRWLLG